MNAALSNLTRSVAGTLRTAPHPDRPTLAQIREYLASCYPQAARWTQHVHPGLEHYDPTPDLYQWRVFARKIADLLECRAHLGHPVDRKNLTRAELRAIDFSA
jgi:hypothetical protein